MACIHFASLLMLIGRLPWLCSAAQPNIVLVLTDDQDQLLGGMSHLPQVASLIANQGANFTNFFVNTPVCCPSRTEILGGRYGHNNLVNSTDRRGRAVDQFGNAGCMHANITGPYFVANQLGTYLSSLGYTTGLFGKYMNNPSCTCPAESGCHGGARGASLPFPLGWDRWFAVCRMGGYFNNTYNDDGSQIAFGHAPSDYMTSVIGNRSVEWIEQAAKGDRPFFAYVAPHAPHISDNVYPYITEPAPWYEGALGNATAPRTPNWNVPNRRAHSIIANQKEMDDFTIDWSDSLYRARQESLKSVDDLVADLIQALERSGALENTYVFFTSDHGYALGQQARPSGKFHVYDNDIRVPMLVRGPGIAPGTLVPVVAGNVDLAATFVDLAGGAPDSEHLDGRSLVPWLSASDQSSGRDWPQTYLVEYWSLGDVNRGPPVSVECNPDEGSDCIKKGCVCHYHRVDGENNTYVAARLVNTSHDFLLALFYQDTTAEGYLPTDFASLTPVFLEAYDLKKDPWQMNNLHPGVEHERPDLFNELKSFIFKMSSCKGSTCRRQSSQQDQLPFAIVL